MLIIGVLLALTLFGVVVPCAIVAAKRGVWLRVEVDQRVEVQVTSTTTTITQHLSYDTPGQAPRGRGLLMGRPRRQLPMLRPHPTYAPIPVRTAPVRKELER